MKLLSQQTALERLEKMISDLRSEISNKYQHRAKNCLTCETQGACCLDAHFVNVHISRLEAMAIQKALSKMPREKHVQVNARIDETIERYALTAEGDTFARTYACPLFESQVGCMVHKEGKPVPCIMHACYEREADLPPGGLQAMAEQRIEALNARTYGRPLPLLPLPLAIRQ